MTKQRRTGHGFTLIELMIVVSIIGIMAAIAIPSFLRFACRSRQSEAKEVMKGLWLTNEVYNGEHATYLTVPQMTTFGGLGPLSVQGKYYAFTIAVNGNVSYTLTATDSVQPIATTGTVDQWNMTESDARALNVVNRCQ